MTGAREIVAALKARRIGSGSYSARCPAHDDRSPSLSLREADNGRVLFYCHSGCPQDRVIDALRRLGLFGKSGEYSPLRTKPPLETKAISSHAGEYSPPDDADRIRRALTIWGEAGDIDGTPGLTYLANRGIDLYRLPRELHRALRWHHQCPWEDGRRGAAWWRSSPMPSPASRRQSIGPR